MVRGNNNQNQVQDTLDPYYVHPSENPTTVCVTPPLTGDNYHAWALKMRRALATKNKFKFVDGSIEVPREEDLNFAAWERCNNLVHSWIVNSTAPSVAESIVFIENAIDVWNDLKDRYMRGDRIRVAQLQQEIANLKQGNRKVTEYFIELRGLWEELEQYRPMPQCNCPIPCSCVAIRNVKTFKLEDRVIQFLIGLNDEYQSVASQILLMEPMPMINKVFSMIMQQERKTQYAIPSSVNDETGILVNVVDGSKSYGRGRGNGPQGRGRGNGRQCTFCNRSGHTIETCYKKHGYPPNFGRGYAGVGSYANFVGGDAVDNEGKSTVASSKNDEDHVSLTKEQYQSLVALLEKSNAETKCVANVTKGIAHVGTSQVAGNVFSAFHQSKMMNYRWIVDTGATHHICYSLHWFLSVKKISPMQVSLPNGSTSETNTIGRIKLNNDLVIDNVLYVPEFQVNLISASKLCREQSCTLTFKSGICMIQEENAMRTIGLAKEQDGLYYLEAEQKATGSVSSLIVSTDKNKVSVSPAILWHMRLGHLAHDRMLCLHKKYSYVPIASHTACDVCHFSRQKKLPFPISNSNAKNVFELIHLDIWGPFST